VSDLKQPPLPGLDYIGRAAAISKRASKERRRKRLPVLQPELIADRGFEPQAGVPRTRSQCPTSRPCPFVRCRWNLFMEDADHRAGRPGLSNVKRDSKGLTMSQPGDAGTDRPGTTLRPGWLKYKGLEVEREVRAYIHAGPEGVDLYETTHGAMDHWLRFTRPGEPVLVFDDDTSGVVARAQVMQDGRVKMDRELPESTFMVVLTRVRAVASCALDEIDRCGRLTNEQTGNALARHRTLIARENKRALEKAIRVAATMGMTAEDLLRGLRELGAGQ
jgi:hypothetical protein